MGNIRIHIEGLREPVETSVEKWMTALLLSLPEPQMKLLLRNLDKVKRQQLTILKPTPGADGKILMPS